MVTWAGLRSSISMLSEMHFRNCLMTKSCETLTVCLTTKISKICHIQNPSPDLRHFFDRLSTKPTSTTTPSDLQSLQLVTFIHSRRQWRFNCLHHLSLWGIKNKAILIIIIKTVVKKTQRKDKHCHSKMNRNIFGTMCCRWIPTSVGSAKFTMSLPLFSL